MVPFLLLRAVPPDPPAPLDLSAPLQQLRDQLEQFQAAAAPLFAPAQKRPQEQDEHQAGGKDAGAGAASLAFLRTPLAARHRVAAPLRGEPLPDPEEEGEGESGGGGGPFAAAPPAVAPGAHGSFLLGPEKSGGSSSLPRQPRQQQRQGGGSMAPLEKSTTSMATSATGATSHGSTRTDAHSPEAQLVGRLRKLQLLRQQADGLFA